MSSKNIYLVKRTDPGGYDSYDSFVVIATDELEARYTYPGPYHRWDDRLGHTTWVFVYHDGSTEPCGPSRCWVDDPEQLEVTKIGVADSTPEDPVILASFNAG
tara:strand:- start:1248 stop:1556 length:309 start_codon:yes stop_codon:yes gene_type:complete